MDLDALAKAGEWKVLYEASQEFIAAGSPHAANWFFSGLAALRLGDAPSAVGYVERGLELAPNSFWGIALLYDALSRTDRLTEALEKLEVFSLRNPTVQAFEFLADRAAAAANFELATRHTAKLLPLRGFKQEQKAIAIQCFAKDDTIKNLLDSLLAQDVSGWSLVILQDAAEGSRHADKYRPGVEKTSAVLDEYSELLRARFSDVRYIRLEQNLGPTLACQVLMDVSFQSSEYVVFFEDDCVASLPTMKWFDFARSLLDQDSWFIAGESLFFNSDSLALSEDISTKLNSISRSKEIASKYTYEAYVPSTCFATNSSTWAACGSTRGLPRGDVHLTSLLRSHKKRTVFPAVPFVRDVGMLHESGYSVTLHGREGVQEIKNQYVIPHEFHPADASELSIDKGLLYAATKRLDERLVDLLCERLTA
jgi:tetratricopeptide (TPR) repeat protein